jgi:type II secretory pathway pseudopilin PulG
MNIAHSIHTDSPDKGYSLIELLIAMGITTAIMGVTLGGLSDAIKANNTVVEITDMNKGLRGALDLMVRDLLQAGAGLPKGHILLIPSGGNLVRIPGPPTPAAVRTVSATDLSLPAVIPGAELGPTINNVKTDVLTILSADNNFTDIPLSAVSSTSVTVADKDHGGPADIGTGIDRVIPGQLMMVLKQTATTLVQVTAVNAGTRVISFATGDSLRLNQTAAAVVGNLDKLNTKQAPIGPGAAAAAATRLTRVRMISYYLDDTTTPGRPRLVRRVNNGHETDFDNNKYGTAVALDVEYLKFTYDLNDGATNPGGVRFVAADLTTSGACAPDDCSPTQIRKVNVTLTGRSLSTTSAQPKVYRNTLTSQVALRGMALVNEYQN